MARLSAKKIAGPRRRRRLRSRPGAPFEESLSSRAPEDRNCIRAFEVNPCCRSCKLSIHLRSGFYPGPSGGGKGMTRPLDSLPAFGENLGWTKRQEDSMNRAGREPAEDVRRRLAAACEEIGLTVVMKRMLLIKEQR